MYSNAKVTKIRSEQRKKRCAAQKMFLFRSCYGQHEAGGTLVRDMRLSVYVEPITGRSDR